MRKGVLCIEGKNIRKLHCQVARINKFSNFYRGDPADDEKVLDRLASGNE